MLKRCVYYATLRYCTVYLLGSKPKECLSLLETLKKSTKSAYRTSKLCDPIVLFYSVRMVAW